MPELPEVETVVNNLKSNLIGQKILAVQVLCAKIFGLDQELIIHQVILDITRRGKYIIIKLNTGYLVGHLRMTGKLFAVSKIKSDFAPNDLNNYAKHLHVIIELQDYFLLFQDQRKFGRINFCENLDWLEQKLGPEPLQEFFTQAYLINIFKSNKQVKALLLDQSKIAGLGNIYVDEILWQAGVHPQALAIKIPDQKIGLIYLATREILQKAISMQGTTFLNYAFDGDKKGNYLNYLKVFNRATKPCLRCSGIIIKIKVAQRGTHVCEVCQK